MRKRGGPPLAAGFAPREQGVGQQDIPTALTRALGLQGPVGNRLDERLQLGVTAYDLTQPEFRWLSRGALAGCQASVAAVAGEQPFCSVGLLSTPNQTLVVVEQVIITNSNASQVIVAVGLGSAVPGGTSTKTRGIPRDDRYGIANTTRASFWYGTDPAPTTPTTTRFWLAANGGQLVLTQPWVVSGQALLNVVCGNTNVNLTVSIFWRERNLHPTEV